MKTFVFAEFDSVDLADLASRRVRSIDGILEIEVVPNRFAGKDRGDRFIVPYLAPTGTSTTMTGFAGVASIYESGLDIRNDDAPETERRQDAELRTEVGSERSAKAAAAVLRNTGGRNVRIIYK